MHRCGSGYLGNHVIRNGIRWCAQTLTRNAHKSSVARGLRIVWFEKLHFLDRLLDFDVVPCYRGVC